MELTRIDQPRATILIVDRDALMLTAVGAVLDMQGHKALLARNEDVAMKVIAGQPLDLIVLSIDELAAGCDFAQRLRSLETTRDVPVIFLVPELLGKWSEKLYQHGGIFSMLKPIDPEALIDLVEKAMWMPHLASLRSGAVPAAHLASVQDWVKLDQ